MKEITAFIHRRIADVIGPLKESGQCNIDPASGCRNLFAFSGKGVFMPDDPQEQHYSTGLAEGVVNKFKLELLCDDDQVDQLVAIIQAAGRTGRGDYIRDKHCQLDFWLGTGRAPTYRQLCYQFFGT